MATPSRARSSRSPRACDLPHVRLSAPQALAAKPIAQGSVGDLERLGSTLARADQRQVEERQARKLAPPVVPHSPHGAHVQPHPSQGPAELVPRRDDGTLARQYTIDKAELVAFGLDEDIPVRRQRADGWTAKVQADFIRALGDGGSVTRVCAAVGRSRQSAYALRRDPTARLFAHAWDEAMASTVTSLAETALDRAVNGQREEVFYKGHCVGHRTRYDNRLLFQMLRARDPLNYAPLDELERWEGRRAPEGDAAVAADELEAAEEEWAHAPREALEAAGELPHDTAAGELARIAEAEERVRMAAAIEAVNSNAQQAREDEREVESRRLHAALLAMAEAHHRGLRDTTDPAKAPDPSTSST